MGNTVEDVRSITRGLICHFSVRRLDLCRFRNHKFEWHGVLVPSVAHRREDKTRKKVSISDTFYWAYLFRASHVQLGMTVLNVRHAFDLTSFLQFPFAFRYSSAVFQQARHATCTEEANTSYSSSLKMSAILSADDLNDFISPSVACVKPIETLPTHPPSDI